jgi:uncharacterized membrane protein
MSFQTAITAAWNKIGGLIDGFIVMLPNIVLALTVFILFFFAARWLKLLAKRITRRHRQARNLGMVLGRLAQGAVIKLVKLWDSLLSSYLFLPAIIVVIAIALAFTMLTLDQKGYYGPLEKWGWMYTGGTDGARAVLSPLLVL